MGIQERFSQTDRALEEVPTWPNVSVTTPDWTIMSSTERASSHQTLQIDKSLTDRLKSPLGIAGADPSEAFKSKLKFQIQHEVFR